ncbi:hypothetical protein BDFB_013406 [Asbolus verrucosus]|uniref:Uncharacterized protein n=1 Tax=Asbolus verrucosus TaxID=1661398 RepID=A0A482VYM4_ASBVE|nr:hypothetical protein BDFB_013406 [Asbolus verrucosus]
MEAPYNVIAKRSKIPSIPLLRGRLNVVTPAENELQFPKSNLGPGGAAPLNPPRFVGDIKPNKAGGCIGTRWLCNLKTEDQGGYQPSEARTSFRASDQHAYLTEFGKAGKLSDSDSGIASPLSPTAAYGFLGYGDKDKEGCSQLIKHNERFKLFCLRETVQVSVSRLRSAWWLCSVAVEEALNDND